MTDRQVQLVNELRSRGYEVVSVRYYTNWSILVRVQRKMNPGRMSLICEQDGTYHRTVQNARVAANTTEGKCLT